tara:strand:- start:1788 stop:2693 length:906 start_codon:yes stop_codon:yes gene_type:complete
MSKGLLYLFVLFFAYQCAPSAASSNNSDITSSEDKKDYITDLIEGNNYKADNNNFQSSKENIFITEIQSELHTNKSEIQNLRAIVKSLSKQLENQQAQDNAEMWSSSLGIYNQEIIMQSGTVYYGNIIYQDPEFVTLETLIGKLNINRSQVVRVVSHQIPDVDDSVEFPGIAVNQSIASAEDGSLLYNKPAEVVLLGNITSYNDDKGDTKLTGSVKNIGGKRADFVKLNITLYRDWSKKLEPKTFSVFVDGETHYLNPDDSSMVSLNSISPKSEASFELHVPQKFGTVMSWTYNIDYEQYE